MDPFDIVQFFMQEAARSTEGALAPIFTLAIQQLGFRYFACASHVNIAQLPATAVLMHNYPSAWVARYMDNRLDLHDPVFQYAERTVLPFHWDDAHFRATCTEGQLAILSEAAGYGVRMGFTVPLHGPWGRRGLHASCSVVPGEQGLGPERYFAVQLMAAHLFSAASRHHVLVKADSTASGLTKRERQCLELAAQGKSDWAIAKLLTLSEHTVHAYIESSKRKLRVHTRIQAVVEALQRHDISFGIVLR